MFDGVSITMLLAASLAAASPIILAALGESLSEQAGVVNLSLDGTILFSSMVSFAAAQKTGSTVLGFASGMLMGMLISLIVGLFAVYYRKSMLAAGFVLTLMCRDMAYFLGKPFSHMEGMVLLNLPIPGLHKIPIIGEIFFNHPLPVYMSLTAIVFFWYMIYRTSWGLWVRATGENSAAVFARGKNDKLIKIFCTISGGAMSGLAGAAISLCIKPGWGRPQGAEGLGWIVLALVIFGGKRPGWAALGAFLFAFLQVSSISLQNIFPALPAQVFQSAPFPVMIFSLAMVHMFTRSNLVLSKSK